MLRKSLLLSVALFLCVSTATLLAASSIMAGKNSNIALFLPGAAGGGPVTLLDGEEDTIPNNTPTNVTVYSNGSLVSIANMVVFLVNSSKGDVTIRVSFSNHTFSAVNSPQPAPQMNILYLKVETNVSTAIAGGVVTLYYNQSEVLFTERALWIYNYTAPNTWNRIDTTVNYDTHSVTFLMPNSVIELCLVGQETRGMEFPIWAWIFILISFGIITFMAVGELVYQGYIPVAMKGTDGRVLVASKRFFGAWGRKFTQLNDRVGGFIDYYENMSRTVPPIPPEKRLKAVSSLGHINRLGLQEEAEALEEVYSPILTPTKPVVIAKTEDKNPLAKAVFQESTPAPAKQEEEPGERTFTPYIPAAVRAKMGEKPQPKPAAEPSKEDKRVKPTSIVKQKPLPTVTPPPSETKTEESTIPPDLLQGATAAIKETPAGEVTPKPAKKTAKKKAAKKIAKKTAKKPAAE